MAGVAQLVRAPVCGTGGRGFKSPYSPQFVRQWRNGRRAGLRNQWATVGVRVPPGAPRKQEKMDYKNIEKNNYKSSFEVSLDQDAISKIIDQKILDKQPTFEIAGFRKGKVPINIIKSKIGPQIENEVLNDEISKNINTISEKEKIQSLVQPDVSFKDSYNFSLAFI